MRELCGESHGSETVALVLAAEPRLGETVTRPVPQAAAATAANGCRDAAALDWVAVLSTPGPRREAAITELHGLLLRAARFEVGRRSATFPQVSANDHDDLARQSADDAMMSILRRLGEFRGQSRFTTWAYKFAVVEAGAKVRRHAWHGREIPLEATRWPHVADTQPTPQQHAEARDLLAALRLDMEHVLTPHQRHVLVSVAINEVPIDVLADQLQTTRGAVYKTLHDARQKLRAGLAARGLGTNGYDRGDEA